MEFSTEQKLYAQVVAKAWDDSQFKENLMKNPIDTIEHLTGYRMALPEGQTLVINDQTDESITYFNIPRKVEISNLELELTDEQLELVAGGESVILAACAILTLVGGSFAFGYSMGKDRATAQK